ncbi:hypothetical protein EYE40_09265 [Glaciihabitans arcticus]|uniref:Zinc-ribbon domain-containing protein n=1 Tax=Glaciihabitans arcticus TaxID=2668039 RepID=A0A4Q9GRI4_9MICO|nr:zinc-ribbon domain-containing protein [Glaciihabitans arcticus]TBN57562.1 hypothetical protein EYE40_09265 [Glaciihabitans arcticus]
MPETVGAWWARRQWSKGCEVPYPIGTFRSDWAQYPALIRQYHPDLNSMITLTQIPPAAEVFLVWQCDVGHLFVATPEEQRMRPGRERRRSSWCPDCLAGAKPMRVRESARDFANSAPRPRRALMTKALVDKPGTVGEPFLSERAPKPASAAEADLRHRLAQRFDFDLTPNAIRVSQPFFERMEIWPDIVIGELRVALEYDTVGRHGLEHVGRREAIDRRKDRILRASGWEVVRIRIGKLQPLGPHDIVAASVTDKLIDRIEERLGEIRGELFVAAYRR